VRFNFYTSINIKHALALTAIPRGVRMAFFTQYPARRPLAVRLAFCLQQQKVSKKWLLLGANDMGETGVFSRSASLS
jgi:hypothetical protein